MNEKYTLVCVKDDDIKIVDGFVIHNHILPLVRNTLVELLQKSSVVVLTYDCDLYIEDIAEFDQMVDEDTFDIWNKDQLQFTFWYGNKVRKMAFKLINEYDLKQPDPSRVSNVNMSFNRDKILDEGVFLAICGLTHCREGLGITGVVRLEMARDRISKAIEFFSQSKNSFSTSSKFVDKTDG